MSSFWRVWRREIVRGAVLFVGVIVAGLVVRHLIAHVRASVAGGIPAALRQLKDVGESFDPDINAGPRLTGETWRYGTKLAPRQWVWIQNTNGSVKVEPAAGDSLEVVAVKTYRRSDPGFVRLEAVPSRDGVAICALWGSGGQCAPGEQFKPSSLRGRGNDVAVDFTVRLPRRVRLSAATVNGGVHIERAGAPLAAVTVNGEIDAETAEGPVRAVAVNGSVRARMTAFGDSGDVSIVTVNGAATAELPARLDADVEARTVNGSIETDYPLPVTGRLGKHLKGTVGAGGRKVQITTVNGAIKLRRAT